MTTDRSQLASKYSAMTDEEFGLINRADLAEWAKPYYDREKTRRSPGWRYETPTPDEKLHELLHMQKQLLRKQNRSVMVGSILGLCGFAFTLLAIPSNRGDLRIYLGSLAILLMVALTSHRIACKSGFVILWLRRFHQRQHRSFQKLLEEACVLVGVPITIQDSSFRFSMGMVNVRIGSVATFGAMTLLLVGFLPVGGIGVDLVVIIFCSAIALATVFARKLGYTKLHQGNAEARTLQLLADIHRRKRSRGGVMILKCEDSFWRDIVSLAIQHADAVVVDITEVSQNVIWELQTALTLKSPENILLAYEKDEGPFDLPPAITTELQAVIGNIPLNKFATFCYPKRVSRVPGKKNFFLSFWASHLREVVTRCVSHSSASVP